MDFNQLRDAKSVAVFLQQSTAKIAEALTGLLASDKNDNKLVAGRLVQAIIKGSLFTQLSREIERYQKEGRIKEDYFATHKNQASLYELLRFLDEEIPDDELFSAIKSIFLSGVSADATKQDEVLAYEFLLTAKKLTGTEILILRAAYEIAQNKVSADVPSTYEIKTSENSRDMWARIIIAQMGYPELNGIVEKYEEHLESLGLIMQRHPRENLADLTKGTSAKFRLTDMGYKFCEFANKFD